MSARELKSQLHEQIEALTDEQTIRVYEFVRISFGGLPVLDRAKLPETLRAALERTESL
jgi:hypothetical protein